MLHSPETQLIASSIFLLFHKIQIQLSKKIIPLELTIKVISITPFDNNFSEIFYLYCCF